MGRILVPALAVVIAGGSGTRFRAAGGDDKLAAPLGATTVLQQLLTGLDPLGLDVLLVGPPQAGVDGRRRVREDPPGGGPAAGLGAALAAAGDAEVLVLLAADQPFAAGAVPRLLAALAEAPGAAGAIGVDGDGRWQPLLSAHRRSALRAPGPGRAIRAAFGTPLVEVPVSVAECLDIDTPADLEVARALLPH